MATPLPTFASGWTWLVSLGVTLAVGAVTVTTGCISACIVGMIMDTLGMSMEWGMGITGWLGLLPPTIASIGLMMGDHFRGGAPIDATRSRLGVRWVDYEGGARFQFRDVAIEPRAGVPTLGGFETAHPDASLLVRDVVRIVSGVLVSGFAMCILGAVAAYNIDGVTFVLGMQTAFALAAAAGLPLGSVALAWRSWWQTRRALDWSDRIVLEGNVLRSDRGDFHFRDPDWSGRIDADGYGHVLTLEDATQQVRIRAPAADLLWVEKQLRLVRLAEGDAEEVPEALARLTRQTE